MFSNKNLLLMGGVAVVVAGGLIFWQLQPKAGIGEDNKESVAGNETANNEIGAVPEIPAVTVYAAADVTGHSNAQSCWSIIDNNVYDLTAWIANHPGGEKAILSLCGKDGTTTFHNKHADAKKQADMLATMKIGALAQ